MVDRLAAAARRGIAAPLRIQAGDLQLGKHVEIDVPVWNLDASADANVSVELDAPAALRVVAAPTRLWPSHAGFDPSKMIRLEFRPTAAGRILGDLTVAMSWPGVSRANEVIHIEVAGGAHAPGAEPLDVQDALSASHALTREAEAARDRERGRVDQAILDEEERDTHFHEGHKRRLDNARTIASNNLGLIYNARRDGIQKADEEIGVFVRALPPESSRVAQDLAAFAIDLATAGIAGGLAKRLEPAIKSIFGTSEAMRHTIRSGAVRIPGRVAENAGPGIVGLIADGVKHLTKAAGKGVRDAASSGTGADEARHEGISADAKSDFLESHRAALRNDTPARAEEVTIRAHDALLPTLQTNHEKAIAAMTEIAMGLKEEAGVASGIQRRETELQWIRLVAQTSLGSTSATEASAHGMATGGRASLTRLASANQTLDDQRPTMPRDGLIDITFTASQDHPEDKVKVTGIKLLGVRKRVAEQVRNIRMLDLGLPARASGFLSGNRSSVTVVRDEGGNVDYTDNTRVPWEQSTWLARKIGVMTHAGDADERRGARQLIEDEIMTGAIGGAGGITLEIDGES